MKKQKETISDQIRPVSAKMSQTPLSGKEIAGLVLYACFAFLAITYSSGTGTMVLLAIALVPLLLACIHRKPFGTVCLHASFPLYALIILSVSYLVAGIYSPFGESAASGLYKYLIAFTTALLALVWFERRHVRGLLWGMTAILSAVSILSIDAASWGYLFKPFSYVMGNLLGVDFKFNYGSVANRISGLYNDSNVTASLFCLAIFIALHLARTAATQKERILANVCLGINAIGMFLSNSRGTLLCFVLSAVLYWAMAAKGTRTRIFLQMVIAGGVSLVMSAFATHAAADSILPDVIAVVSGLVIYLVDWLIGENLDRVLSNYTKLLRGAAVAMAILVVVYVVAAFQLTAPITLQSGQNVLRTLNFAPGEYTVTGDYDGDLTVIVGAFDERALVKEELAQKVFEGSMQDGVSFTIPEGTEKVNVILTTSDGATVRSVRFSDGTQLKLKYLLLPASIANRFQGSIFKDSSFLLRAQYMKDALKIWSTSPIFGRGLGSTEGLYESVQPYHYMSLFVHNHLLQYMADMGLVGLLAYLAMAGGVLWLLLRQWKQEREDPMPPMLIACWAMINLHSLMEINMSLRSYLTIHLVFCAVVIIAYGEKPLLLNGSGQQFERSVKRCGLAAGALLFSFLLVMGGIMETYRMVHRASSEYESNDYNVFMKTLESFIFWDCINDDYYKQIYIRNAYNDSTRFAKVSKYVTDMYDSGTYENCGTLAAGFFLPRGDLPNMFDCSRRAIAQAPSTARAWNYQIDFYRDGVLPAVNEDFMPEYIEGVLATRDYLASYNQDRIEPVEIAEEYQEYLDAVYEVWKSEMDAATAYQFLSLYVKE